MNSRPNKSYFDDELGMRVVAPPGDANVEALRAGLWVSLASIVWTGLTSTAAVIIGVATNSLVVVAFGLTGLLDAAASVTLVMHFRHALHHEEPSERHERLALRLVTIGLLGVGLATAAESLHRLLRHPTTESAPAAVALAAVSAVVLVGLAVRKRRVGAGIPSRALMADGLLSLVGAMLAAVTVAGTALTAAFGWRWADPVAALMVAAGAAVAGVLVARE